MFGVAETSFYAVHFKAERPVCRVVCRCCHRHCCCGRARTAPYHPFPNPDGRVALTLEQRPCHLFVSIVNKRMNCDTFSQHGGTTDVDSLFLGCS